MTRLIVITFAALGWSFYVMSGGAEFEPRGLRSEQPQRVASVEKPAPVEPTQVEQLVTNVAARTPAVRVQPAPVDEDVVEVVAENTGLANFSSLTVFEDQGATITLASLEDGVAGLQQVTDEVQEDVAETPVVPEPEKDIREISGTRVNMRDGPGTIYPIIAKVGIGQKVEVLSESGTGWLRLRVLPQQQVGWISASLVRKIPN